MALGPAEEILNYGLNAGVMVSLGEGLHVAVIPTGQEECGCALFFT